MRFAAHYLPTYIPELDGPVGAFYDHLFEQMELLDRLGFDDVWITEHHFSEYGGTVPSPPTFLASIARTTSRIHLGAAVTVVPLQHPLHIAEAYAMVDVISHGRLEFGLGRGNSYAESEAFGMDFEESALRLREGTEVILRAWSDAPLTFQGELFRYSDLRVLPKPVQRPHPEIWVGASRTDDTFRWAGQMGFNLMTLPYLYETSVLEQCIRIYREALVESGHDPSTREVLGKFHVYVAESNEAARYEAAGYVDNYGRVAQAHPGRRGPRRDGRPSFDDQMAKGDIIAGDARQCIQFIEHWRDTLGLTCISGTFHFGGMPQEMALDNIRLFADRVMPAFRE